MRRKLSIKTDGTREGTKIFLEGKQIAGLTRVRLFGKKTMEKILFMNFTIGLRKKNQN
jgi:hypothetical protein